MPEVHFTQSAKQFKGMLLLPCSARSSEDLCSGDTADKTPTSISSHTNELCVSQWENERDDYTTQSMILKMDSLIQTYVQLKIDLHTSILK